MSKVIARMFVQRISRAAYSPQSSEVELAAVSRGNENAKWAAATPSGSVKLQINNGPAAAFFTEAFDAKAEIYVTFEVADDPTCPVCDKPIHTTDGTSATRYVDADHKQYAGTTYVHIGDCARTISDQLVEG